MFLELMRKRQRLQKELPDTSHTPAALARLARAYFNHQDYRNAVKIYKQIPDMTGLPAVEAYRAASNYKRLGEINEAQSWFKQVLETSEDNKLQGGTYFHLGEMALGNGNRQEAKQFFKKCLQLMPDHKKAVLLLEEL